jgi:prepilin-type N-terminal cleavage/methylation domain-containing protein
MRNKDGFTLLELMVVVGIIGLLAGIATAKFVSLAAKTRDARRLNDAESIAKAIMLYQADHVDTPACGLVQDCNGDFAPGGCFSNALLPYISHLPFDPFGEGYCYTVCTNGDACNAAFPGSPFYVQITLEKTGVNQYLYLGNP